MLALALGGRSVDEWKEVISPAAFQRWIEHFRHEPFDDLHRFYRPAALIAASFGGGAVSELQEWLQPDVASAELSEVDIALLKALNVKRKAG